MHEVMMLKMSLVCPGLIYTFIAVTFLHIQLKTHIIDPPFYYSIGCLLLASETLNIILPRNNFSFLVKGINKKRPKYSTKVKLIVAHFHGRILWSC